MTINIGCKSSNQSRLSSNCTEATHSVDCAAYETRITGQNRLAEKDELNPELITLIENLAYFLGFTLLDEVSGKPFTLRRSLSLTKSNRNREQVENFLDSAIIRFGLKVKFEWSATDYEYLIVEVVTR
jgi:hypothetical protein